MTAKILPPNATAGRSLLALLAALSLFALALTGCGKTITSTEPLAAATPASSDPAAGQWKMIVLSGPTQVAVPAPALTTDPGYQAELAAIKTAQAAITPDQQTLITYWSAGGAIRWNEIMRELVARQNLPPAPNPDGSYPAPNAANPFANPQYPFANPPYAARAYSYVTVAQYEALKSAWHYKFQYNRASPFKNDSGIKNLLPDTGLPSYPSEDAVESAVNATLLTLLFPTNAAEIAQHAADQQMVAQLSGRASTSDIAAGVALGNSVANVLKARAANDGMKAAGGTPAIWAQLATDAKARGEIPWLSQDGPPRPPMLPVFNKVTGWMVTPADIVANRPAVPYSTSSAAMANETTEVRQAVENITRDQLATVYKWADGVSTPTPPGHWNMIAVPYITAAGMSEVRAARTFALLDMSLHDAAIACWDAKYAYFNPRPSQMDPNIKVWTGLPNFPSYVSGHSVFSSAAAETLTAIFPANAAYFQGQAREAADSRFYSGIHYRSDIEVGLQLGAKIADYTVRFAQTDGAN